MLLQAASSHLEALQDLQQAFNLKNSSNEDLILQKRLDVFKCCQGAKDSKACQVEAYEKALRSNDAKAVKKLEESLSKFLS